MNVDDDVDKYLADVSNETKQPLADSLGGYYFDVRDKLLFRAFVNSVESEKVRSDLQKGVGLMLPVYRLANNKHWGLDRSPGPEVMPDWDASKRRWKFLTEKLKLKLLPMSATEKFDAALIEKSLGQGNPLPSFYYDTFKVIVAQSGLKPDYLVDNGLTQDRFGLIPVTLRTRENAPQLDGVDINPFFINYLSELIANGSSISFLPMSVYNKMKSGSVYLNSQCLVIDTVDYKRLLAERSSGGWLVSFMDQALDKQRGRTAPMSRRLWEFYQSVIARQANNASFLEQSCESAMTALGFTGSIRSGRLD